MKTLNVKGRYLVWDSGEPFFYLGDTAWELFHALSREETEQYMKERRRPVILRTGVMRWRQ